MALIGINPVRGRDRKDTMDRVLQGVQLAQGILGLGTAIPEFIQKRKLRGAQIESEEAEAEKTRAEAMPLTPMQREELKTKFDLPDILVPRTIGEARSGQFQITPAEKRKLEQKDRELDIKEAAAKRQAEQERKRAAEAGQPKKKELSAQAVLRVNEGNVIPTTLSDVAKTINTSGMFSTASPFTGFARSINPFDPQAQTVNAQMRAASQQFGRFMEGGVLRKEDEEKYKRMFPKVGDTKEVAEGKLNVINTLLRNKQESDLKALERQGFDTTGLELPPERRFVNGVEYEKVDGGWLEVTGVR